MKKCLEVGMNDKEVEASPSYCADLVRPPKPEAPAAPFTYKVTSSFHPRSCILQELEAGYHRLLERRIEIHRKIRMEHNNGQDDGIALKPRGTIFMPHLRMIVFTQMSREEVNLLAELLDAIPEYFKLPEACKAKMFRNFWIYFLIIERTFDTVETLGECESEKRILFYDGRVMDLDSLHVLFKEVANNLPDRELERLSPPWIELAARIVLPAMKRIKPSKTEFMFILALMLFNFELADNMSKEMGTLFREIIESVYYELEEYYNVSQPSASRVQRTTQLSKLIALTEKAVMRRKDTILLSNFFNLYKADIFLTDLSPDS